MSSDWKDSANKRKDIKHTKISDEHSPTVPNKRDTKKWCKGKVGTEHQLECQRYSVVKNTGKLFQEWRLLVCIVCGKELDIYYGGKDKPDWAKWWVK